MTDDQHADKQRGITEMMRRGELDVFAALREKGRLREIHRSRLMGPASKRLRWSILCRDNFRCVYCGATPSEGATLEVDHIIPRSRGGSSHAANLATACFNCNRGKAARVLGVTA